MDRSACKGVPVLSLFTLTAGSNIRALTLALTWLTHICLALLTILTARISSCHNYYLFLLFDRNNTCCRSAVCRCRRCLMSIRSRSCCLRLNGLDPDVLLHNCFFFRCFIHCYRLFSFRIRRLIFFEMSGDHCNGIIFDTAVPGLGSYAFFVEERYYVLAICT